MTEYQYTTNSRVFKRLHNLKNLSCSHCRPHRGDNNTRKYYGSTGKKETRIKYPSWKLASKNRKQWMPKTTLKKVKDYKHAFPMWWFSHKRDLNSFTFVFFRDIRGL